MDGVTNYYNTPYMIDLINQGSQIIPDFYINVTERFTHPEIPWHFYVPGSPKATLSVVGLYIFFAFLLSNFPYIHITYSQR